MKSMGWKAWITVGTAAVAALGMLAVAQRKMDVAASGAGRPEAGRPGVVVAAGRVEPAGEEVKVGSEIDGRLARVLVDEGDSVRRGQVIAVLENGDFAARVELAKAAVSERAADLSRLRNGSRPEEKREAEAQLREADAMRQEAEAYLAVAVSERDRRAALLLRRAVSRSEHDLAARDAGTAASRLRAATERVAAARDRLALVMSRTRVEELERGEAELRHARAARLEAEALLAKTVIRSPIDGQVLRRYRKAGESVSGSGDTPVFSLGDLRRLRVRADIDETDVARVRVGQRAWVRAEAFGTREFHGRVVRVGSILGRKNVLTDNPTERVDTKVLETLIELDPGQVLPVGLRVDAFLPVEE